MVAFQVFIQLICSLLRLPPSATALELAAAPAPALELGTAPATGLELGTASTSLETTTVVKPVARITAEYKNVRSEIGKRSYNNFFLLFQKMLF